MKFLRIAMAGIMLTGCATPATQNALNNASVACQQGWSQACGQVPYLQAQASAEAQTHGEIAAIGLLLPLVILAALAGGGGGGHHHHRGR